MWALLVKIFAELFTDMALEKENIYRSIWPWLYLYWCYYCGGGRKSGNLDKKGRRRDRDFERHAKEIMACDFLPGAMFVWDLP